MLTIYDPSGTNAYPLTDIPADSFCVTHVSGGLDTLSFDISPTHAHYAKIVEEASVQFGDNRYVIKSINERETCSSVSCELDLDFLRQAIYYDYRKETTLDDLLNFHMRPGWTVKDAGLVSLVPVIELDAATDYDIIMKAAEVYGVCYRWNIKSRILTVIKPQNIQPSGEYLTDELNLRSCSFKGSSSNLVTRLFCEGKDGLTFASINGGKAYVDNFGYSNKIISASWKDDKCESEQELLNNAIERLKSLAYPVRSYECDVVDLAKVNPDYSFLSLELYKVVTLIDRRHSTRTNHRVVEYKEFPLNPSRNVVTLANVVQNIETTIKKVETNFNNELQATEHKLSEWIQDADGIYAKVEEVYSKGATDTRIASQLGVFADTIRSEVSEQYTTKTTTDAISNKLDHLKIGTRNLLLDSGKEFSTIGYNFIEQEYQIANLTPGKTYTFAIRGSIGESGCFLARFKNSSYYYGTQFSLDSNEKLFFGKIVTNSEIENPLTISSYYQNQPPDDQVTVMKWAALYEGDIIPPEDWTPALEDNEDELKIINSQLSIIEQKSSEINQKVEKNSESLTSATGQLATLTRQVSEVQQKADSVTTQVSSMGGNNLIHGSAANSLGGWLTSGSVSLDRVSSAARGTETGGLFRVVNGSLSQEIATISGKTYAYRFLYQASVGSCAVSFGGTAIELAKSATWKEYTGSFSALSTLTTITFTVENGTLLIADPTVVTGLMCSAWEQAAGEIDTAEMRVDRKGIHMKKEGETLETQITYREFRVLNSTSGESIAYFSDSGAEFDETKVNKNLTIASSNDTKNLVVKPQGDGHIYFIIND